MRNREPRGDASSLVPCRVDTRASLQDPAAPFSPSCLLRNAFEDGDEVFVAMHSSSRPDNRGMRRLADGWGERAFHQSDAAVAMRRARHAHDASEQLERTQQLQHKLKGLLKCATAGLALMGTSDESPTAAASAGAGAGAGAASTSTPSDAFGFGSIMESLGHTADMSRTAASMLTTMQAPTAQKMLDVDWPRLKLLPALIVDPTDREPLRKVLLNHYNSLRDVFRYFSNLIGPGSSADSAFNISMNEWLLFMTECNIRVSRYSPTLIYAAACTGVAPWDNPRLAGAGMASMDRARFVDGVCLLAAAVAAENLTGAGLAGFVGLMGADGNRFSIKPTLLEVLLTNSIEPRAAAVTSTSRVNKLMAALEARTLMVSARPSIKRVFDSFSTDGMLSQREFLNAMVMTGLLAAPATLTSLNDTMRKILVSSENDGDVLTKNEAMLAFHLAQDTDEGEGLKTLNMEEFEVALGHVAMLKWEDPATPFHAKLLHVWAAFKRFLKAADCAMGRAPSVGLHAGA